MTGRSKRAEQLNYILAIEEIRVEMKSETRSES